MLVSVAVVLTGLLLKYFTVGRGYTRSGQGNPDEARAARYILKDYVNAKILYCHPPPGVSEASFNQRTHELALLRAIDKKRAPVTRVGKSADTFVPSNVPTLPTEGVLPALGQGHKSQAVDQAFFTNASNLGYLPFVQGSARNGQEFSRAKLFPHQNAVANDGSALNGRRARIASVLANQGTDVGAGKKHHMKSKRVKQRSGKGYDV
jgi:large subunit GTPase 1